jgi:cell wall-associated NlpC family hydrolase
MVVAQPVADVRSQPHTVAQPNVHDPLQETQLLYGERVRLVRREDDWAKIEAVEQAEYTHGKTWQSYPGWVRAEALIPWEEEARDPTIVITTKWATLWRTPYKTDTASWRLPLGSQLQGLDLGGVLWQVELLDGSSAWISHEEARSLDELRALPVEVKRQRVLRAAEQFLGDPYYWGGRSPFAGPSGSDVTGVDCSALVNLAYRTVGLAIPRDAHEQSLRATPVATLQPADLIFLSEPSNPQRIVHVMLYADGGTVIEGPGTGQHVRRIAVAERLGQPVETLVPGTIVNDQTVSFGAYLP